MAFDIFATGKIDTHLEDIPLVLMIVLERSPAGSEARFDAPLTALRNGQTWIRTEYGAGSYAGACSSFSIWLVSAPTWTGWIVFHGALATTTPARKGQVEARILVLNGGDDPIVPVKQVGPFKTEMTEAAVQALKW